jgi:hypothetical protein
MSGHQTFLQSIHFLVPFAGVNSARGHKRVLDLSAGFLANIGDQIPREFRPCVNYETTQEIRPTRRCGLPPQSRSI